MTNPLNALRELSAELRREAERHAAEREYGYEHICNAHAERIDAIVRESEAQGDVGAVDAWERRLRGRAGPFTAQAGERYVEADVALEAFRFALAASATSEPDADLELIWHSVSDNAETNAAYRRLKARLAALNPKKQESECPWGGCGDCVGHEAIQPAGDGARVTEADRELRKRADQMILRLRQFALIQRRRRYPKNAELAVECAELLAALAAREGGAS